MKKATLLICMSLVWGCDDSTISSFDCGHGSLRNDVCQCDEGYKYDLNRSCTLCADGYTKNNKNVCVKNGSGDPGDDPGDNADDGKCRTTCHYFNEWSNTGACGVDNFDVYLIGSFNDWKEADPEYKMTSNGDGSHSITVEWAEGSDYTYKY